jgi:hypothetical protein
VGEKGGEKTKEKDGEGRSAAIGIINDRNRTKMRTGASATTTITSGPAILLAISVDNEDAPFYRTASGKKVSLRINGDP